LLEFANEYKLDIVSPAIREFELSYDLTSYAETFVNAMKNCNRFGIADGICFMVSKKVFDEIGFFDENFRVGQYEDSDFFYRAELAGFKLGTTGRSFIHHFGSITQKELKENISNDNYASENRTYFNKKWKRHWIKRMNIRRNMEKQINKWKEDELKLGHTLKEKEINGQLEFY
jgi:GT2 family glycosyltransferase